MEITLYSLSDYNAGNLLSRTFDLEDYDNHGEYLAAIAEWLEELTEELDDGETREEWIVADYEDIPSQYVGEYDLDSDFWEYKTLINSSHLSAEAIAAGIDCGISLEDIEEAYQGEYKDDEDFAYSMADDLGLINDSAQWPYTCIDWERAARELMFDYCSSEGHYFRNL